MRKNSLTCFLQASLEGYIVGKLAVLGLSRVDSSLSKNSFLRSVYQTGIFSIGELNIGPFSNTSTSFCNQGMHTVYIAEFSSTGKNYTQVPDFTFQMQTCGVQYVTPIVLNMMRLNSIRWIFIMVSFLATLSSLILLGFSYYLRNTATIQAKSPVFCYALCVGTMISVSTVLVNGWDISTQEGRRQQCEASVWLMVLGYSSISSCLLGSSANVYIMYRCVAVYFEFHPRSRLFF